MNRDKIQEVLIEKNDELATLAGSISPNFDPQVIHDFRVGFKFLRSFLRLIRMHNPDTGLKPPDRLKDLYTIAGTIRDLQLELQHTMKDLPSLTDYIGEVKQSIVHQQRIWDRTYNAKIIERFGKQIKRHKFDPLPEGILTNFLQSRMMSIDDFASLTDPTDSEVHGIRKEAKDIIYAAKAVHENWQSASGKLKIVPLKELHKMAERIGDYNDDRLHLQNLGHFSERLDEGEHKASITAMANKKAPSIAKEKTDILALVRKLLHKQTGNVQAKRNA